MKTLSAKMLAPLAFFAFASAAQASELVTNGDFSSGSTDWTVNSAYLNSLNISNGTANFASYLPTDDELSQMLTNTVSGQTYRFTFDLNTIMANSNDFSAYFGGQKVYSESNASHSWTTYSFLVTATGANTLLAFYGANQGSVTKLDNVSVSAVPLPASGYLMLSALGMIGFLSTRRGSKPTGSMKLA